MPRDRRSATSEHNTLVASAVRYPMKTDRVYRTAESWQKEAWRHYDICGELRFAANWVANVVSRATLHAAVRKDGAVDRHAASAEAENVIEGLFNGPNGQAQMLRSLALHLVVAGEGYLVEREEDGEQISEIVGSEEINHAAGKWSINYGDGRLPVQLSDDDTVVRIWTSHPRTRVMADSPVRSVLPILREIEYLNRHIFAQVRSRLTGAGILQLPQEMSFPPPPNSNGNKAEDFMVYLSEVMGQALEDPGDPSAMVPLVVTMPAELIGEADLLKFWSPLDEHAIELRQEALRRLALGLDIPPEVMLGTGDMNHWGAWQMEESSIKAHIEPMLETISNALTVGYLQPITDDKSDVVAYDTAQIRLRPNRSKEALELYDRGQLDGDALRRETGFSPDDRPDPQELRDWFIRKVASGSTTPELVAEALRQIGVDLGEPEDGYGPTQAPSSPSMLEHPRRELPAQQAALIAASEVLVFRALERAGNRLKNLSQVRPPGVAAADLYQYVAVKESSVDRLLEDAWSCADRVLDGEAETVVASLDAYCRSLLLSQQGHSREKMVQFLTAAQEASA